jgi:RimJ/RimL family protein N-acetyltransferase
VRLVPVDVDLHLENYVKWLNDPEVTRWLLRTLPLTRLEERAFLERVAAGQASDVFWAVHDEHGRHIGGTGIHGIDWIHRSGTTGIVLGERSAWGRGYGKEVMALRTSYAFDELGLNRLESECFVENVASARCLEATGYKRIGIARARRWKHGAFRDTILWDFLAADYRTGG